MSLIVMPKVGLSGEFKYILRDLMGRKVFESEWSSNLILDDGLDVIGSGATGTLAPCTYYSIGDSAAALDQTQTGLQGYLASSTVNVGSDITAWAGGPNWEYSKMRTHRFAAGLGTGTIREMGSGASVGGANMFCRHLVTPEIDKTVDIVLDVIYRLTHWPPLVDVNQAAAITMEGEDYNVLIRGCRYDRTDVNDAMSAMSVSGSSNDERVYDGDIGATFLDEPSGETQSNYGGILNQNLTYVPGNSYRDVLWEWGLNNANLTLGLRSMKIRATGALMQVQFDRVSSPGSSIPKDETKVADLTYRQAWVRH